MGPLIFLACLHGHLTYLRGSTDLFLQYAALLVAGLVLASMWSSGNLLHVFPIKGKANGVAGWASAVFLMPILMLSAGTEENFLSLHSLAAAVILGQALVCNLGNVPVAGVMAAGLAYLVSTASFLPKTVLLKTVLSGVIIQNALLSTLGSTFSVGESAFLAQLFVMAKYMWSQGGWLFVYDLCYFSVITTCIGTVLAVMLAKQVNFLRGFLLLPVSISGAGALIFRFLRFDPAVWTAELTSLISDPSSHTVFLIWGGSFLGLAALTYFFYASEDEEPYMLQIARKSYHFILLLIIMFSGFYNLPLTQIGLTGALCFFIGLEGLRHILQATHTGHALDEFFKKFAVEDEKNGDAIVPHVALLAGSALPVILSQVHNSIHAYSGIFALGIADASASIFGSLLGEHKWPNSNKSIEGTLIAMVATYIFISFITDLVAFEQAVPELPSIFIFSCLLPVWEAMSDINDNLSLPIVAYALSRQVF